MAINFPNDSPLAEHAHGFLRSLRAQKRSVNTQDTYLRGVLELDKFLAALASEIAETLHSLEDVYLQLIDDDAEGARR